jgi:low affinity Fe/Cu permease
MKAAKTQSAFTRLAKGTSRIAGQPRTFGLCVLIILVWAALGPFFKFSDTWQLVINTSTTIITFLMVFLIQSTQNRESEATQLKLDELIRAIGGAQNALIDLEEQEEADLDQVREGYLKLANNARLASKRRIQKARAAKAASRKKKQKSG